LPVAWILARPQSTFARELTKFRSRDLDERPDDHPRPRANCRKPSRAGAAHEPKQEGFGLIVECGPPRNHVSTDSIGRRMQKPVTQLTRHVFDRPACVA